MDTRLGYFSGSGWAIRRVVVFLMGGEAMLSLVTGANSVAASVVLPAYWPSMCAALAPNVAVEPEGEEDFDTTPPVITVLGDDPALAECGDLYGDAGATATDDVDGAVAVTDDVAQVADTSDAGQFTITYTAVDGAGNTATASRAVVVSGENCPSYCSLNAIEILTPGDGNTLVLPVGTSTPIVLSSEAELSTANCCDVEVTYQVDSQGFVNNVSVDVENNFPVITPVLPAGTYVISATAVLVGLGEDPVSDEISVALVEYVDMTPPVITLNGSAMVIVDCGESYTDAGATALDEMDGYLTDSIVAGNPVNTDVPGAYTVTYDVSDAGGNAAVQVWRTVRVRDNCPGEGEGTPSAAEVARLLLDGFGAADGDNSGALTLQEAQAAEAGLTEAVFNELDANEDGVLTPKELRCGARPRCCCGCLQRGQGMLWDYLADWFFLGLLALGMVAWPRRRP